MRRGVLLGLIAVVCWSLAVGSAVAGDLTLMAKGGGKNPPLKAPAPVPQTGQTTSYAPGDDGDLQKGVALPIPRFTDNGNGTVTDNLTGLIWLKNANCPGGTLNWYEALDFVAGINSGVNDCGDISKAGNNQTDWRLPNVRELQSLVDYGQSNLELPALPLGHPFTGFQESDYWSSTTNTRRTDYAWSVGFYFGYGAFAGKTDGPFFVTAVRGGN